MIKNTKGGGKVRKYAVLTIFTFIFVLLACNAAAAADTSSNNSSTLQTHEQLQNNSQLTNNQSYTTSNSQKTSKNTTQLKNITITWKVERCNSGGPFSGVTITVKNNGTTLASTTTKKDGTYTVNFQSIYTLFQVTASSTGHNPSTKNITVSSNGSYYRTANFKLGADNIYIDDNWANYRNGRSVQFYDGTTHTIGSDAFDTISEAVSNVNAGGTIYIANGTYTVQGVSINKNLNIIGQSRDGVILTGGNSNRIFAISSGRTVTISNITFTNGLASNSNGGAIQNNGGTLTLNNCAFTSNKATRTGYWDNNDVYGGAIYSTGTLTIRNSNFTSNTVTSGSNNYAYGGAIYNSGTLTITGSNFTSNTATTYGGAIINYGTLTITGSNFTSNTAYDGGAISNGDTGTSPTGSLTITGSNFTSNTATSAGGAIWTHGTCNVTGSNFTSNTANDSGGDTAKGSGGAIRNWGTLTVTGSNFTWNSATTNGGAISNYQGTANINFNRIIGNGANDINAEYNGGTSTVNAENNWWGSNTGASAGRVTAANSASVDANPWIILKINASPTSILVGGTSAVTADLTWNSNNIQPTGGRVPDGTVNFSGTLGSVNPTSGVMVNGLTTTTFTAGNTSGTATVSATLDGVTVSTPITLRPVANLEITQTVNSPVNVGSTVTYTVTVKNNGPNTANNIRIQDLIPAGFTVDTHGVGSYSSGIWTIPSLANGESVILTITGTATASMAGLTTSNTATELDQTEEHTSPLPTSTAGVYTKKADVKLTQTTSSTPVNVGDTVTYTVTATNRGPDTATNINIRDIIPSGLTDYVITPSAGTTYSNGIWTIPNLINGGIATLTIAGKAGADMAGLTTTNTATRISQTEYNSESATSTSSGIYVKKANVVITNTANSSKLNVGQTGTFTVTVTNNGPDTATNIVINDPLPNGFSASVTGGTYSNGVWTINSLASQQSVTLTFTGLITSAMAGTNIVNHATETQTEYPPAVISDATIHVNKANVVVTITPSNNRPNVGQSYTYTVTVKNNGDDDATDVTVSGAVPDGLTLNNYHISMGSFTSNGWYIGTLASGNTAILTVTVTPQSSAAGQDITAAVTETQNEYPQTNSATSTVHVPKANVAISKTVNDVSKAIVNVGNTITYLITVTNNGPDSATGLQITDLVPSGLSNLVYSASTGTYSLATGLWNIGTLLNGETATLSITGKITSAMAGLTITNYATITAENEYSSLPVVSAADVYTKLAEVQLSQTATPKANVGNTVTYKVYVTNNGPDTATNIILSDIPPSQLSNLHVTPSIGTYSDGVWTIPSLANGETAILTITGTATSSMAGKSTSNTATLTAQTEYDPSTIGDSTTASVYTKEADVALSQTGSYYGNKVTFIVKATNNGPDSATNINIKDLIPTGLTGASVKVSVGTYDSTTGIWTIPSLANGEVAILNITGNATPQTTIGNIATRTAQDEYNSENNTSKISIYVPNVNLYMYNYAWYSGVYTYNYKQQIVMLAQVN
ncbi:beta strand repeat-containing protein, partial [Methanobacterium veterum]